VLKAAVKAAKKLNNESEKRKYKKGELIIIGSPFL
jgi:hypothetical protein